jgi:hypothetical protein
MISKWLLIYLSIACVIAAASCTSRAQTPAATAPITIDDKSPAWIWDHMYTCDTLDSSTCSSHAGGDGCSGTYIFSGTGVTLYGPGSRTIQVNNAVHRVGKIKISIDGVSEGEFPEYVPGQSSKTPVFTFHNLQSGNHSLIVEPVDSWIAVSSLTIDNSAPTASTEAPADSITKTYFTDFKNGDTKGWVAYGGTWTVTGKWYVASPENGNKTLLSGSQFADFTYNADICIAGSGDSGLILRVTSPAVGTDAYNGYYVGLDLIKQAVVIGKVSNSWNPLAQQPYTLQAGATYHLRVVAAGNVISAYVQGQYICSINDNSFPSGAIGLRTFGTAAAFTNVQAAKSAN